MPIMRTSIVFHYFFFKFKNIIHDIFVCYIGFNFNAPETV